MKKTEEFMFCKNCGTALPNEALFCSKCGQATTDVEFVDRHSSRLNKKNSIFAPGNKSLLNIMAKKNQVRKDGTLMFFAMWEYGRESSAGAHYFVGCDASAYPRLIN